MGSINNTIVDLIGRSDGKQSTISKIYNFLPKETYWNKKVTCNEKCSDMKNSIQQQIFMKNLLSSMDKMKLGTFRRQMPWIFKSNSNLQFIEKIGEVTCLEFGNDNCNNGTVNLMGIMEKMKFAYHSATSKDLMKMQQKLSEANFTYKLNNIAIGEDEVIEVLMYYNHLKNTLSIK